jgi:crotonobetainyl-CoA:carnitine CoA-transferase CaiB-like acyl-CoA transferase
LSALVNQSTAFAAGGVTPSRMGNAHPSLAPYDSFRARDETLVVAVGNDAQFGRLCDVLQDPALTDDPRFASMPARNRHREELRALLASRFATRDAEEWFRLLRNARVPAAPVLDVGEGIRFANDLGLSPIVESGKGERRVPTIRHPIDFAGVSLDYSQAPPLLDADRAAIEAWLAASEAGTRPTEP